MNISRRVTEILKASEFWRPDHMHLYSPDQVFRAVEQARAEAFPAISEIMGAEKKEESKRK